MTAMITHKQW